MNKGFYIKHLQVVGQGLPTAEVTFESGLNVISGASNTGKSYIFQCIDFVLGSGKKPKPITEANGYSEIRLQINTWDNKNYTLAREFDGGKIRLVEDNILNFSQKSSIELNLRSDDDSDNNVSSFLLDLIGLKNCKLKKDANNAKKSLTFRDLVKFCMIDETQIISEDSPIYSGQYIDKTAEESLFKLLLSGTDDSNLEERENPKNTKQRLTGALEFINKSIENKSIELHSLEKLTESFKDDQVNAKIEEFTQIINQSHQAIYAEEQKRQEKWKEIEQIRSAMDELTEVQKRLGLLNSHYTSDLKRLEFINEGKQYLDQLKTVNCPICSNVINKEVLDKYVETTEQPLIESITSEAKKIQEKQKDLTSTTKDFGEKLKKLQEESSKKTKEFELIELTIKNKLKPIVEIHSKNLKTFLDAKENKSKINILINEIKYLTQQKEYYANAIKESSKRQPILAKRVIPENYYESFSNQLSEILKRWGLKYKTVNYNKESNDIKLDDKIRTEFGKGLRAIIRSAFMVGLIRHCQIKDTPHPAFLILDSPLTAYKGQDQDIHEEDIPVDIESLFFDSLEEYARNKDIQIIILDNKEPTGEIKKKINYLHYSGNDTHKPAGFYPKQD